MERDPTSDEDQLIRAESTANRRAMMVSAEETRLLLFRCSGLAGTDASWQSNPLSCGGHNVRSIKSSAFRSFSGVNANWGGC